MTLSQVRSCMLAQLIWCATLCILCIYSNILKRGLKFLQGASEEPPEGLVLGPWAERELNLHGQGSLIYNPQGCKAKRNTASKSLQTSLTGAMTAAIGQKPCVGQPWSRWPPPHIRLWSNSHLWPERKEPIYLTFLGALDLLHFPASLSPRPGSRVMQCPHCPGLRCFPEYRTFRAKTRSSGQTSTVVYPTWKPNPTLLT